MPMLFIGMLTNPCRQGETEKMQKNADYALRKRGVLQQHVSEALQHKAHKELLQLRPPAETPL